MNAQSTLGVQAAPAPRDGGRMVVVTGGVPFMNEKGKMVREVCQLRSRKGDKKRAGMLGLGVATNKAYKKRLKKLRHLAAKAAAVGAPCP